MMHGPINIRFTYLRYLYAILFYVFKPNFGILVHSLSPGENMNLLTRIQVTEMKFIHVVLGGKGQISVTERSEKKIKSILPKSSTMSNIIAYCNFLQHAACLNSEAFSLCLTKTYCFFNTKNNELMVFREITDGYSENHTKRQVCFESKLQSFLLLNKVTCSKH